MEKSIGRTGSFARIFAGIGLVSLFAACTGLFDPTGSELEENMEKWAESGIEDYRFRFKRLCFCVFVDLVEIEVVDGEIVSVVVVETGEPPHTDIMDTFLTIDGIFAEIRDAIDRDAFSPSVTYHETLGYPTEVDIDYEENTVDEEMSYRASGVVQLN
jgi:hypothetical protein